MAEKHMLEAGGRLADHLRTLGVQNPMVGAGSTHLFIYGLRKDKARIGAIAEWEGVPVKISLGGSIRAYGAPSLSAGESGI